MNPIPDISVIVPIYNVEQYLPRCIESIIHQTHQNIEIILVDDGSPDKSGEIADAYAEKDERIRVIHQENKWLGGARNSGIKIAKGKYLLFVDSDDYIREDTCALLFERIERDNADMVVFDMYHVDKDNNVLSVGHAPLTPDHLYTDEEVQSVLYPLIIGTHSLNSACMKIYKRSLLVDNHLLFDESIRYAEDYAFCLELFPRVQSFSYYQEPFYYYVENGASIMHARDEAIVDKFITLYHYREAFLEKHHLSNAENERLSAELLIKMIVINLPKYLGVGKLTGRDEKMALIDTLCQHETIQQALTKINVQNMDLGRYGRAIIYALKRRMPHAIYAIYQMKMKQEQ